jgi:hypothetical protein
VLPAAHGRDVDDNSINWSRATWYAALDVFLCSHSYPGPGVCIISGPPRFLPRDEIDIAFTRNMRISVPSLSIPPTQLSGYLFQDQALVGWLAVPELDARTDVISVELHFASTRRVFDLYPRPAADPACSVARGSASATSGGQSEVCIAVVTMFAPGGRESPAWIQHWMSIGAAHVYVYLHVEVSGFIVALVDSL